MKEENLNLSKCDSCKTHYEYQVARAGFGAPGGFLCQNCGARVNTGGSVLRYRAKGAGEWEEPPAEPND